MVTKKIWVIGHKNPDTDSICAAIAYSYLKNEMEKKKSADRMKLEYIPKRAGAINPETAYVLEHFGVEEPELWRM